MQTLLRLPNLPTQRLSKTRFLNNPRITHLHILLPLLPIITILPIHILHFRTTSSLSLPFSTSSFITSITFRILRWRCAYPSRRRRKSDRRRRRLGRNLLLLLT